jgi:hypothetical protein
MTVRRLGIAILLVVMVGCDWERRVEEDADRVGNADIELNQATFGYLKQKLSAVKLTVGDCYGKNNVHYVDCKKADWGSAMLVEARFVTGEGFFGSKGLADTHRIYDIEINSHFKGTLCGAPMQEVVDSKTACGRPISFADYNSGRYDVIWSAN